MCFSMTLTDIWLICFFLCYVLSLSFSLPCALNPLHPPPYKTRQQRLDPCVRAGPALSRVRRVRSSGLPTPQQPQAGAEGQPDLGLAGRDASAYGGTQRPSFAAASKLLLQYVFLLPLPGLLYHVLFLCPSPWAYFTRLHGLIFPVPLGYVTHTSGSFSPHV